MNTDVTLAPPGQPTYLGDGLYAQFDGLQVWLHASRDDGVHRVALDPAVFGCLLHYMSPWWAPIIDSRAADGSEPEQEVADLERAAAQAVRNAAPELLRAAQAALQALDRWADMLGNTPPFSRADMPMYELLRNAISKARPGL